MITPVPEVKSEVAHRLVELIDHDIDYVPFHERALVTDILADIALYLRQKHPAFATLTLFEIEQLLMPLERNLDSRIHSHVQEFRCAVGSEIGSTLYDDLDPDED